MNDELDGEKGAKSFSSSYQDYVVFREFLSKNCGIMLSDENRYLIDSRLGKIISAHHCASLLELIDKMSQGTGKSLEEEVIDAMTTNETSWFRDNKPFTFLKNTILKDMRYNDKKRVRVGSFACSSGEEAYSIAIILNEFKHMYPGTFANGIEVVGFDISSEMISTATKGIYTQNMLQGLNPDRRKVYLLATDDGNFEVQDDIKKLVSFRKHNLLSSFLLLGKFDVVFCRNVLFYFDKETRIEILKKIFGCLNVGGYLILGGPESLGQYQVNDLGPDINYKIIENSNYQYYVKC